jgi:hypothetical protein
VQNQLTAVCRRLDTSRDGFILAKTQLCQTNDQDGENSALHMLDFVWAR